MVSHTAMDLYSTWASIERGHTTQFQFDDIHVMRQRRGAARRHSSPSSARYAHCHVSQQALCQTNVLRGMRNASKRVKRSTCRSPLAPYAARTNGPERDDKPTCRTSRANGPHTSLSSERANTSVPHENDPRKAAAAPPAPTWRRWSQKSASPQRKSRVQRPWRQRRLRHTARNNSDLLPSRSRLNHYPRA